MVPSPQRTPHQRTRRLADRSPADQIRLGLWRDEDAPDRAEEQERAVRHEGPPTDPARREQDDEDHAGGEQPREEAGECAHQPGHQPDPGEELHVAEPERPGAERQRQEEQPERHDDRDRDRGQQVPADERVPRRDVEDQRDRDDREGQLVGEQPLVEICREADDERREPQSKQGEGQRIASRIEPRPEDRERERAERRDRGRPPAERPAGGVLRVVLVVLGPADREPVGGDAEGRPAEGQQGDEEVQAFAPARASSTSVAWVTPVAPRAAYGWVFRK